MSLGHTSQGLQEIHTLTDSTLLTKTNYSYKINIEISATTSNNHTDNSQFSLSAINIESLFGSGLEVN